MASSPARSLMAEGPGFTRIMAAIGGIYIAQTLLSAVTFRALPTIMREQGADLRVVGLVSLLMLPWAFKFIWAPAVERYRRPANGGRRSRTIVVSGQLAVAALLAGCAVFGPAQAAPLFALLAVAATICATIDIACDAYAIESLPAGDRGWANTAQVGGSYLGAVLGAGLFVWVYAEAGWAPALLLMACLLVLFALPFATMPPVTGHIGATSAPHRPSLAFALRRRDVHVGLVVITLYTLGIGPMMSLSGPLLVDAGLGLEAIAAVTGIGSIAAGLGGAVFGGWLVRAMGARMAMLASLTLLTLYLGALAACAALAVPPVVLAAMVALGGVVTAIGFVCVYALLMGLSSDLQAGVDFTLFQCANALVQAVGGTLAGFLAHGLGYGGTFALSAAISLVALITIPKLLNFLPAEQA